MDINTILFYKDMFSKYFPFAKFVFYRIQKNHNKKQELKELKDGNKKEDENLKVSVKTNRKIKSKKNILFMLLSIGQLLIVLDKIYYNTKMKNIENEAETQDYYKTNEG